MRRIVPGKTNQKLPIILKFTLSDILYLLISISIIILTLVLMLVGKANVILLGVIMLLEIIIAIIFFAKVSEYRLYYYMRHIFMYLFRKKEIPTSTIKEALGIDMKDDAIVSENGIYSRIIHVKGIDFSLIPENSQDIRISHLAIVLSNIEKGKIVKLDKAVSFTNNAIETKERLEYFTSLYEKIENKDSIEALSLEARIKGLSIDLEIFEGLENSKTIDSPSYYIIIYNENRSNLMNDIERAIRTLNNMGLASYLLDKKETYDFYLEFFNSKLNDDKKIIFNGIKEHPKFIETNGKKYAIQTISELPYIVDNAWLASLSLIKGVNLVVNFRNNPDLGKAIKRINKRIVNLGEMLLGKNTESERMELETQIAAYQELLEELKFSKVQLHIVEIMLIYEYDKNTQKEIASIIKSNIKAKLDPLSFRQMEVYINSFPHLPTKDIKWLQRDFPSSTFAGSFPFISDLFIDKHGDYIGNNSGPVFFDMWDNINNKGGSRTNANIMTIGASGKGKSYLQKILIKNQLLRDDKIFILDPENEYSYIANMFGGNIIDVSGGDIRINPFEIFPELDEENKATRTYGALSKHLAFLSDFFRVVMPDLTPFTRQVLQNKITMLYNEKGIYAYGYKKNKDDKKYIPLNEIKSKVFPTFDDLIKLLSDINIDKLGTQEAEAIVELNAFLQDFNKDGRFGMIWNGPSTIKINNDFTVFNFRGLESGSSDEIKNGQMLLITKYLMKEIINNYELNYHRNDNEKKKIVLLVDEAHNFIDPEFPVALDMMKNMAKRIRKYSGSLWVATQNIADFIGFDVNTRTKATAVINNCQYTFLFGLKPDDIDQVKNMYSKSTVGALTNEEIDFLSMAGQGDALLMIDASTRLSFHVSLKDIEKEESLILHKN